MAASPLTVGCFLAVAVCAEIARADEASISPQPASMRPN